jgi:hypothetical protein
MRMPSLRLNMPQDTVIPESQTLQLWLDRVMYLTKVHGEDMVLYVSASKLVEFKLSTDVSFDMNIEQTSIPNDIELTLKQWKEALKKLINKYSEDTLMYPVSESEQIHFYLSPIKRD